MNDADILNYVRIISNTKSKKLRTTLAVGAPPRVFKTLCNFCSNALYNTSIRGHVQKCKSLRQNKQLIELLATRRVSVTGKRRILSSSAGNFLRELISSVSNGLGENLNDVVSR